MSTRSHSRSTRLLAAAAMLAGCELPTDRSEGMYVHVGADAPVLLRGATTELTASVWIRAGDGDSVAVPNAELVWTTGDPQLATVAALDGSSARITGVNPGIVEIRALAPGYEGAAPGVFQLRVANPLEIDSISPDTVRYGELLVAHGVGVGSLFFAGLGGGTLGIDSLAVAGDPTGLGAQAFWVAYPASSGVLFAAGSGQLVAAPEPTIVLPWDLYEPNQAAPTPLDLDGPPPYPPAPQVRFYNPALAYEELRGAAFGYDWYRLSTATPASPRTFLLFAPGLRGTHGAYLTDDAGGAGGSLTWRLGPGMYDCKGYELRLPVAPADSVIVALGRLPAGSIDFVSAYVQQGRYAMVVLDGYLTAQGVAPDRFEENDLCTFADENFADPARRIDLAVPFVDVLTIDVPQEIDWLRFRVPGAAPQQVAVRTLAPTVGGRDLTDIDVYILRVPNATQGLDLLGGNADAGSNALATATLEPGDYYVAVVDSAGVPTPYALCIAVGPDCALPAPGGAASPSVSPSPGPGAPVRPRRAVRARSGIERPRR
jgi:hypothetical protein